ncbi:hypothetical protein [Aeromonas phage L9-6]|nr:hypothetical protein [Aeromonas phage L9-6]
MKYSIKFKNGASIKEFGEECRSTNAEIIFILQFNEVNATKDPDGCYRLIGPAGWNYTDSEGDDLIVSRVEAHVYFDIAPLEFNAKLKDSEAFHTIVSAGYIEHGDTCFVEDFIGLDEVHFIKTTKDGYIVNHGAGYPIHMKGDPLKLFNDVGE